MWYGCRYLDGEFVYRIGANALNLTSAMLPEEPMFVNSSHFTSLYDFVN